MSSIAKVLFDILERNGIHALVAVLLLVLWITYKNLRETKKELLDERVENRKLQERVIDLTEDNIKAMTQVESTVASMHSFLTQIVNRLI